jgi:hypothetical protein
MNRNERKSALTSRILAYVRRHAIAVLALVCSVLAMAGSSYAAFTIKGSQIVNHTIPPSKFNPKFINGSVRAWAVVRPDGRVIAGAGGPRVFSLEIPGFWGMRWRVIFQGRCETSATVDYRTSLLTEQLPVSGASVPFRAGFAVASTAGVPGKRGDETDVQTFNQSGQPTPLGFDVAVIC